METKQRALISGDWSEGLDFIRQLLKTEPFRVDTATASELKEAIESGDHDVVIIANQDMSAEGEGPIAQVKRYNDELPIILLSPKNDYEVAIELIKAGASDYFAPPFPKEKMKKSISHQAKLYRLTKKVFFSEKPGSSGSPYESMIGQSEPMQEIFNIITAVAKSNATVLILGESGTGKELVAKAIHRRSERVSHRFVDLNCGAIPRDLLENELFGHEKGAFTGAHARYLGSFEAAHRGTLFLDEISEMDPLLQVKLLRVLQERNFTRIGGTERINVDVRIVAATNRNLPEDIAQGRFREDLYYRLNVVNIMMPPLRERRSDIPLIAQHFLTYFSAKNNRIFLDFATESMEALINYDWPGNVRELENTIERVVVLHNSSQVKLKFLPKHIQKVNRAIHYTKAPSANPEDSKIQPLDDLEKQAIEVALMHFRGNVSIAAKKLKIGQATLYRKVKKYGIQV